MARTTVALVALCLLVFLAGLGCRSVYAEGSYARLGNVRLSHLPSETRELIESLVKAHNDAEARGLALWAQGQQFERDANMMAALAAYQEIPRSGALPPSDLDERIRWCRARMAVDARWADDKLLATARRMDLEKGLGLYREVVRSVADNYVDKVGYARLLVNGLTNLRAAMASETFRERHAMSDDAAARAAFLGGLDILARKIGEEKKLTSFTARYYVRQVCEENERTIGLPCGVIISEMLFGAAEHLDEYTTYMTHEMYEELKSDINGQFVGLGVEVRQDEGHIRIVNVFDSGPASKAGIQGGDILVAVDAENLEGKSLGEAARLIRGPRGSQVAVKVDRNGEQMTFTATRDTINVPSVRRTAHLGDGGRIGYIQVSNFQRSTGFEVSRALDQLADDGPLEAMVLDLRGNPGGLLDAAVDVCNLFIDKGTVLTTRGRGFGQTQTYRVGHWRYNYHSQPLVILVDGRSASASEIVAGALHDHGRATLVGSRTYGKGIVQSVLPIEGGQSALYVTTARFFGPQEVPFHGIGIAPDVAVETPDEPARTPGDEPNPAADAALRRALDVVAESMRQGTSVARADTVAAPLPTP
ncbi:MAG: S41 family peptidase [Planctomycetes bacterium]|nr:S41 family peptidase [Planctomycetota bacterium]